MRTKCRGNTAGKLPCMQYSNKALSLRNLQSFRIHSNVLLLSGSNNGLIKLILHTRQFIYPRQKGSSKYCKYCSSFLHGRMVQVNTVNITVCSCPRQNRPKVFQLGDNFANISPLIAFSV